MVCTIYIITLYLCIVFEVLYVGVFGMYERRMCLIVCKCNCFVSVAEGLEKRQQHYHLKCIILGWPSLHTFVLVSSHFFVYCCFCRGDMMKVYVFPVFI